MHDLVARLADGLIGEAIRELYGARRNVIGQRLPLAGVQRDLAAAARHLRAAEGKIAEALRALGSAVQDGTPSSSN